MYILCRERNFLFLFRIAGNSWGVDENGTGCVGCGPQEQFRGCADVAIGDNFTDYYLTSEHEYTPVTISDE